METKQLPIKLDKPIVFFDVETTGLSISSDKIVSLAITKLMPDGTKESKNILLNPVIAISEEASAIHGYTNEMLYDKPKFENIAKSLYSQICDCYLGGFNNTGFDNQILQEEFARCGIEFPEYNHISVDAYAIFKEYEKRDLTAAVKFYCGKEMENAHDAQADIDATVDVFLAQLEKYEQLKGLSIEDIAKIGRNDKWVDWQGRITRDEDGDYIWGFGKPKGKKIKNELGFADWIQSNDFPQSFKNLCKKIQIEIANNK